jgi:hypothetical protein
VRIDDLSGNNWTELSGIGSGDRQLAQYNTAVAFDSRGRIYIADTGNGRVVRMDDITGANWTTLSQSPVINSYVFSIGAPIGVALDASDRIYITNGSQVIRVDDIAGTNWTSIGIESGAHSIAVDASGMVLLGGGGAQIVDNMLAVQTSSSQLTEFYGPYYVFGATPVPLPTPRPSAISFSPTTLTFSQNVGTTSPAQTITIANFGGSPLNALSFSTNNGFSQTNNCPPVLAAGSTCTASVTFTPPVTGEVTGTLTASDDSGNLGATQTLTLSGTGTYPAALVTPAALSFSSLVVGATSNSRTITLLSTGTGPLQGMNVIAAGPFSQTNNCFSDLAPGSSCTIQIAFAPAVVGAASGSVTIVDNAGTQTVSLAGNGSAPVSLSSTSASFGSVAVGNTSSTRTVTVTNRLGIAVSFSGITTAGPFAIASSTCAASLAPAASCTVGVAFAPTTLGAAAGVLTFTDTALTSPQTVSLSGTGSAPVTLSTSSISFGTVTVGTTSSARSVTLTNRQNVALTATSVAASAGFVVTSNTCGASVAAGASCSVSVTFSPTARGAATGTLVFNDSAALGPQVVSLSGTGR